MIIGFLSYDICCHIVLQRLLNESAVIGPVCIADRHAYVVYRSAAFMDTLNFSICCPSQEHNNMGIGSCMKNNVPRLQFAAADGGSTGCKSCSAFIGKPVSRHRPVDPVDPSGTVKSL